MTYGDLKRGLSELTDEQLKQDVRVSGEEHSARVCEMWILEEDHINPSGEGMEPVSAYLDDPEYGQEFVDGEVIVAKKGTVLLVEDAL
jgi:hypothetical protein